MQLRTAKKQRVRERILEVCEQAFRSRGFDATTIDDIAAGAEISRQTFFNYFASKEAALTEVGMRWFAASSELVSADSPRAQASPDVVAGLRAGLARQVRGLERDREFARLIFTRSGVVFPQSADVGGPKDASRRDRTRQWFEQTASLIRLAQTRGEMDPSLDPLQGAEILVGTVLVTLRLALTDYWSTDEDLETRTLAAFDRLMTGFVPRRD